MSIISALEIIFNGLFEDFPSFVIKIINNFLFPSNAFIAASIVNFSSAIMK